MKVLILSCNTGEGHNAAGRAVKDYLEYKGHQVVMLDFMMLAGKRTSRIVGGAYVKIARDIPKKEIPCILCKCADGKAFETLSSGA